MTTQTTTRRRVARWVACALVTTACLCVGSVPARADDTPVRIASATPTAPEPGTLMPGVEITMDIRIRYGLDGSDTDTLNTVEVTIRLTPRGLSLTRSGRVLTPISSQKLPSPQLAAS